MVNNKNNLTETRVKGVPVTLHDTFDDIKGAFSGTLAFIDICKEYEGKVSGKEVGKVLLEGLKGVRKPGKSQLIEETCYVTMVNEPVDTSTSSKIITEELVDTNGNPESDFVQ